MPHVNAAIPKDRRINSVIGHQLGDIIMTRRYLWRWRQHRCTTGSDRWPGGICVSDKVHQEIRGKVDVFARDIGLQTLKNIAEPVRVYEIALAAIKPRLEDLGSLGQLRMAAERTKPNASPIPACRRWARTMRHFLRPQCRHHERTD